MGIDTNVFSEPDQLEPKHDFTMTVTLAANLWLRLGRSGLSATVKEDLVYYQKYASERSANNSDTLGVMVPFNRLKLNGGVSYVNTRDRPGYEIDARSKRREIGYSGAVEVRALSKTFFGVRGERMNVDFDKAAVFLNSNLQYELNRTLTTGGLTIRHQLTPLTSLMLDVSRKQDRFQFSSLRDSDATHIAGGVKFESFALINGSASFGYIEFTPLSPDLPGFTGATAAVDLSYVARGSTKIGVNGTRNVQYSYDIFQPYYLLTSINASLAQQIYGPLEVVGRIGAGRLNYRDRIRPIVAVLGRTDYVHSYGGGVGYRLGKDLRIGANFDWQRRTSAVRPYDGLLFGISVTYVL
jgi:hypothetical protein